MIDGYRAGDVPNPDMLCNREIKFGAFLRAAREYGATAIATGHYARVQECGGQVHLYCGSDVAKDQSFFLAALSQEQLRHVAMPLGAMKKSEVRALAAEFKLPNAKKKDSQGVCFLGEIELRSFMRHYIPLSEGAVVLPDGTRIGTHSGAALYAIGQRHGFRVDHARTGHAQFYVVQKHMDQNTIVVEEGSSESSGRRILITSLELSGLSWIGTRATVADYSSMSLIPRYHASPVPISSMEIRDEGRARVVLRHPIPPISSGQHVAFLFGDEILGSGVVRSPL
jgi:tRNA-specific 2-thiouridylase